jgi:uncharacterized integral membrane protein (TIGR00698 family)
MPERVWGFLPGVGLCAGIALAAGVITTYVSGSHLGSAVVAMCFGIVLAQMLPAERIGPGCDRVIHILLPLGIVLLGARVRIDELIGLGFWGVGMGVCVIALSSAVFFALTRWGRGRLSPRLAVLLAVGNGICGGSAIAAVAPVLGARRDEIAASIAAVVVAGTVGTLALPLLGGLLELSPRDFGLWAGLSLQQTPQVVAAGLAHGAEAGAIATSAKLVRISLLVPVIFGLGVVLQRGSGSQCERKLRGLVPGFLWGFLLLSAAGSLSLLPEISVRFEPASWLAGWQGELGLREFASGGSELCMVFAMAAIGLQTRWDTLKKVGPYALIASLVCATVVATTVGLIVAAS